ncbi:glycosyltransferase family 39 protein [Streptomyces sp. NPDC048290]|uniref:ArnT family glycosyltransferase n=1 Tax=Streptomyces sp. NPDC048290 TaxID=3155811 RepID=UPI00342328BD
MTSTTTPHDPTSTPAPPPTPVASAAPRPAVPHHRPPLLRRVWRGRPEDPRWVRPAFLGALVVIGALYTWNLTSSGYANSFYSAAVQAGSESWKAFFFGSLDASNAITVDKPPASLWPMSLSVRLLGLNSFAILFPEVLMAVATAGVLYAAVRRRFGAGAGFVTMTVFALTPVAALMFRFNNPDASLALLMALAVHCTLRALERARARWLMWAGAVIGLAFLVKTLQAFLILPVLALVYLLLAPTTVRKRIGHLLLAGLAMVVAGGWWVAAVELWPASSRPYIGGSQNNSFLELTFGYNGLGRLNGEETGSVGGGGRGWGEVGWDRMFNASVGGQISWLIPAALILLLAALWLVREAPRTDTARAAFLLWGGSLLITMVVFSFMQGIFHEYYVVALAPYLAPLIGMGVVVLWEERSRAWVALALAAAATATAVWGYVLLNRTPDYLPWLKWPVLVGGLVAALGLVFVTRLGRPLALGVVGLGAVASLAGPTAYSLSTLDVGHTGSIVTAGPAVEGARGGFGGGGNGPNPQGEQTAQGAPPAGAFNRNGTGGPPQGRTGGGGGMGGLLDGAEVGTEARQLLADSAGYTWAAAASGAQNAASYQLAAGVPVMAIGGFNSSDPSPTLAQFQRYVADGKIHYYITGGGFDGGGGDGTSGQIATWVEQNFTEVTVGTSTFYDLTSPVSATTG